MKRILVASGRNVDAERLRAELDGPRDDAYELFVLYTVGERSIQTGLLRTAGYWRARYSELDGLLAAFAHAGVLCDGLTTVGDPVEAVDRLLRELVPDEVVVVPTGRIRAVEARLRSLLQAYARDSVCPIRTTWLTA